MYTVQVIFIYLADLVLYIVYSAVFTSITVYAILRLLLIVATKPIV